MRYFRFVLASGVSLAGLACLCRAFGSPDAFGLVLVGIGLSCLGLALVFDS